MAFDPIPIKKGDSPRERAIKRRIDAKRRGKGKQKDVRGPGDKKDPTKKN